MRGLIVTQGRERACWKKTRDDFCDRAPKLKTAVLKKFDDISDCSDINYCHLESITSLNLSGDFEPTDDDCDSHELILSPSDFVGFTGLETLDLSGQCLKGLKSYTGSEGFFSELDSIERINLSDSDVFKLSSDFFNGVMDTLDDGGVVVTDFIYCSSPESPFKSKLGVTEGTNADFSGTGAYSNIDTTEYCY